MDLMNIHTEQPGDLMRYDEEGRPLLTTTGRCEKCVDMRRQSPGRVRTAGRPAYLASLPLEPTFSDLRSGRSYLFNVAANLRLTQLGYVDGEECTQQNLVLCTLPAPVRRAVQAGEFLVLNLTDDTLFYLLWHPDLGSYTALGPLPAFVEPEMALEGGRFFTASVPEVGAPKNLSDLREGVPETFAGGAEAAVKEARKIADAMAEGGGYWTQPVAVRVGARLWDGSLLYLSEPKLTPGMAYRGSERTGLTLLRNSDGTVASTARASLSVPAYRLRVSLPESRLGAWSDVICRLEVWVSAQPVHVDYSQAAAVSYNQGTDSLGVTLATHDEGARLAGLAALPMKRVATMPVVSEATSLTVSRNEEALTVLPSAATPMQGPLTARAAAGFGGFLHLGGVGEAWPQPQMPAAASDTLGTRSECTVTVTLRTTSGNVEVSSSGTVPSSGGSILPFFSYPRGEAVQARIGVREPGGACYESVLALSPDDSGRAVFTGAGLEGLQLAAVPSLTPAAEAPAPRCSHGAVVTMGRGNPFMRRCTTQEVGGTVSRLEAQPIGGGAYTRQYLYAFCDTGIVALTHNIAGVHANARRISGLRLKGPGSLAATSSGIYAMTDVDSLVKITDARVERKLKGIPGIERLAYDERLDDLWLLPATGSGWALVVDPSRFLRSAMEGSLRSCTPAPVPSTSGRFLHTERRNGAWRLLGSESGSEREEGLWVSAPMPLPQAELATLNFFIGGLPSVDASVDMRLMRYTLEPECDPESEGFSFLKCAIGGEGTVGVRIPFSPFRAAPEGMCRVAIAGIFDFLTLPAFGEPVNFGPGELLIRRKPRSSKRKTPPL